MKFINPSVEYLPQPSGIQGIWHQIAAATRTCYLSEARTDETDEEFVKRVILKPALVEGDLSDLKSCKFNNIKGHFGCLEHGTVYLKSRPIMHGKYSRINFVTDNIGRPWACITTNVRTLIENNLMECLDYIVDPTENHFKRYTFKVVTDIGVTREMNRHRTFSICEQSTRYCDFTKDKFGGELTFIQPNWFGGDDAGYELIQAYIKAEEFYKALRKLGYKPEQARQVLPLGLKTEAVYTAFADDWKHFLALRADNASGKSHPNIQYIANEIKKKLTELQVI